MNEALRQPLLTTFTDAHVEDAVRLFCNVFSAPPWNEHWTQTEARARIREVRAGVGSNGRVITGPSLIGFALGSETISESGERAFLVQEMAVRADRQCQGFGTRLLRAIEQNAARAGIDAVEVLTVEGKWPCYFYEKNGYRFRAQFPGEQIILGKSLI